PPFVGGILGWRSPAYVRWAHATGLAIQTPMSRLVLGRRRRSVNPLADDAPDRFHSTVPTDGGIAVTSRKSPDEALVARIGQHDLLQVPAWLAPEGSATQRVAMAPPPLPVLRTEATRVVTALASGDRAA